MKTKGLYRVIQKCTDNYLPWTKNVNFIKYVNTKFSEKAIQKSYRHCSEVSTSVFGNAARSKELEHIQRQLTRLSYY